MEKIVRMDNQSGLVLEGGGMRGVFTCGGVDNFMDRGRICRGSGDVPSIAI